MEQPRQLEKPGYIFWLKAGLILLYLKEGLLEFLADITEAEHKRILRSLNLTQYSACNGCDLKHLQPNHKPKEEEHNGSRKKTCPVGNYNCNCIKSKTIPCRKNVCGAIYDEIIHCHATPASPSWKNTDVHKWCSSSFELAKCFINAPGYLQKATLSEIDCAGLIHIVICNRRIQSHINCHIDGNDVFSKMLQHRNKIFHSPSMEISEKELISIREDSVSILEDTKELKQRQDAKTCVKKIIEIQNANIKITANEEANVCKAAMAAIAMLPENLKEMSDKIKFLEKKIKGIEGENAKLPIMHDRIGHLEKRMEDIDIYRRTRSSVANEQDPPVETTTYELTTIVKNAVQQALQEKPHTCTRKLEVVGAEIQVSGNEDTQTTLDLVEQMIKTVTNEAIKRTQSSKECTDIRIAIQNILDEIRSNTGMNALAAEIRCVTIRFDSCTYEQLLSLLNYLESEDMKQRLNELAIVLSRHFNMKKEHLRMSVSLSLETLQCVMAELDDAMTEETRLKERVTAFVSTPENELHVSDRKEIHKSTGVTSEELTRWEREEVNIAVVGRPGSGKSTLVNVLRGITEKDADYAPTGVTETTSYAKCYAHPKNPNVNIWDLPGYDTPFFPFADYLDNETISVKPYDVFIIITCSRIYANDIDLAKELDKRKLLYLFVRSKCDHDIAFKSKDEVIQILQKNRKDCADKLKFSSIENKDIYLISGKFPNHPMLDFEKLSIRILDNLSGLKRDALLFSIPVTTEVLLDKVISALKGRMLYVASASCAGAVVPIPGLSLAVDLILINKEIEFYKIKLGLNKENIEKVLKIAGIGAKEMSEKMQCKSMKFVMDPSVGGFAIDYMNSLSVLTTVAATEMITHGLFLIPVLGSIVGGAGSFASTYYTLKYILNAMSEDARKIIQILNESIVRISLKH